MLLSGNLSTLTITSCGGKNTSPAWGDFDQGTGNRSSKTAPRAGLVCLPAPSWHWRCQVWGGQLVGTDLQPGEQPKWSGSGVEQCNGAELYPGLLALQACPAVGISPHKSPGLCISSPCTSTGCRLCFHAESILYKDPLCPKQIPAFPLWTEISGSKSASPAGKPYILNFNPSMKAGHYSTVTERFNC